MSTRKVTPASTVISLEQARSAAAALRQASLKMDKLEAVRKSKVADLEARYQEEVQPYAEKAQYAKAVLEEYATAQRATWNAKSLNLGHATIGFRITPQTCVPCAEISWDEVVGNLLANYPTLIKTTHAANKKALVEALNAAGGQEIADTCLVELYQEERFYATAN